MNGAAAGAAADNQADAVITVMIVEDDPALQEVYRMILSSQGFRVLSAMNGMEALTQLRDHAPDIMLLDYFMPVMDGQTFLANFDETQHPDMRIIVTSNISDTRVLREMLVQGAHGYVLKSDLSPTQLIDLVQRAAEGGALPPDD